jgi:hypothetical protein
MNKPCHYCGADDCRCTYRYMRKGASGVEVYTTHPTTYAAMKEHVERILNTYPAGQECLFKFSVTRTKEEK